MTKPTPKKKARIKDVTPEYTGFLSINKYVIEKETHDGGTQEVTWLMMERGHAVGILAYDPVEDKVVLVNEMRAGILVAGGEPFTDTLPAGGIAKNETPIEAAIRETKEETGLDLEKPMIIHDNSYVSSGGTSERISIVFGIVAAKKAGGIHGCADENEDIKTTVLSSDEFMERIRRNEINDLKTMVAGYWLMENRQRLMAEYTPCDRLSQDIEDKLSNGAPVAEIRQTLDEYKKHAYKRGFLNDPVLHDFFRICAKHGRFDFIFDETAQKNHFSTGGREVSYDVVKITIEVLNAWPDNKDFIKDADRILLKELVKKDDEYIDTLISRVHYSVREGNKHEGIAKLLLGTGRHHLADVWLQKAQAEMSHAIKNPIAYDESGGAYNAVIGARAHLSLCEKIKEAIDRNLPPVNATKPPVRKM